MLLNDREQILALTREWKGERYENGRPKVSDEKIEILKTLTQEEIWHPLYACGYRFQFLDQFFVFSRHFLPFCNITGLNRNHWRA